MKKLILGFICAMALLTGGAQAATKTWIVIGDSILSGVPQGQSKDMALNLVSNERDVIFKSIASPGAALAVTDNTGFNNQTTLSVIDQIAGFWAYYDGILIQAGTNDFSRSVSWGDTYNATKAIILKAKALGKKVMILDPIWRADEDTPNAAGNVLNQYRWFMWTICGDYPDTCYFAHRGETVMGTSAGAAFYDATEVAQGKQLHPNVMGHRKLADWIKQEAAKAGFF